MSIIYAKRFAACCTSRASRRGRRSGKGGGSGERRAARGGGEEPQAPPGLEPRVCGAARLSPLRVQDWRLDRGPRVTFPSVEDRAVTTVSLWWSTALPKSQAQVHVCPPGWERRGNSDVTQAQGLRSPCAHPRGTGVLDVLLCSLSRLREGRGPTRSLRSSQAPEGVKRKAKFEVMEKNKPLFWGQ